MSSATARDACLLLPTAPGVYRFRDRSGSVLYVGRATNLRSRTRSYWGDLDQRRHLRRMVGQIGSVEALVCASVHESTWLERNLLERSMPRWNRAVGGSEVPVWLHLREDAERLGLALDHGERTPASGERFGPFLGAATTRSARSGLLRLWPLHLTGVQPDAADRVMAEARGVGARDRREFAARIRAVLLRRPEALQDAEAHLLALRHRATGNLAFEVAQQVQREIEALQWLGAPQRVTGASIEGPVHGFVGDTLLTLGFHGGRLDEWRVERTPPEVGHRLARATPQHWQRFVHENATLADRLLGFQR